MQTSARLPRCFQKYFRILMWNYFLFLLQLYFKSTKAANNEYIFSTNNTHVPSNESLCICAASVNISRLYLFCFEWPEVLQFWSGVALNMLFNDFPVMQIIAGRPPLKQIKEVAVCQPACSTCLSDGVQVADH